MATVTKISVLVATAAALAACVSHSDIEGRTVGGGAPAMPIPALLFIWLIFR